MRTLSVEVGLLPGYRPLSGFSFSQAISFSAYIRLYTGLAVGPTAIA